MPTGMHEMVLNLLARRVSDRKLFPVLYRRFESASRVSTFAARTVLQVLRCAIKSCRRNIVSSNHKQIGRFLSNACERIARSDEYVTLREEIAMTYSDFVVRLNELELRPIFHALCVWGSSSEAESSEEEQSEEKRKRSDDDDSYVSLRRRSVLVCVVSRLLSRLGGIFVPFVGNVWNMCAATLLIRRESVVGQDQEQQQQGRKRRKQSTTQSKRIENSGVSVLEDLQTQVLVLIRRTCRHDTTSTFINAVRFKLMMPSLIAQLDASEYEKTEYINRTTKYVIPSIWQFACAAGTDVLWKPLNHRILLNTRSSNATTRWGALSAIQALYTHVGEDMLSLLPESIPFIAELLEDSDETVHELCLEVKDMIEELSGEKLDNYLQ